MLHMMVGLPCSGKTTWARQLAEQHRAIRLTPDEWHITLFGQDFSHPDHDARHDAVEALMWDVAKTALSAGVDVILDFGFWSRAERQGFRAQAHALGASSVLHFANVTEDELLARLAQRNAELSPMTFRFTAADLQGWMALFEPPAEEELVCQQG